MLKYKDFIPGKVYLRIDKPNHFYIFKNDYFTTFFYFTRITKHREIIEIGFPAHIAYKMELASNPIQVLYGNK